ncbi:unnamed protein product [Didymodactylos carnosus]|uniref:Cell division cycle protein 123 homolog n=1 Tax=Didymodactylos carnosus TaxID=1234261 RepID=A0A813TRK8_9BILA|nr:unnamed protein product [Didymodactylos carnosus]CAF3604573.1 unnamed protein product [Didymodactylos carnosus]
MTMSGFSKMRALTTKFNDDPVRASRPFDRLRDGFVSDMSSTFSDQLKSVRLRKTTPADFENKEQNLLCPDSETYLKLMSDTYFDKYYEQIKPWTFQSISIPLSLEYTQALHDGHQLFLKLLSASSSSTCNNIQYPQRDLYDKLTNECFEKYAPLSRLCDDIDQFKSSLRMPMFVRLSTRSPKDAGLILKERLKILYQQMMPSATTDDMNQCLIAFDEASIRLLCVSDGFDCVQLLLASERIQDDFKSTSLNLILRYFERNRRLENEFRGFIYRRKLTALTQYNESIYYPNLLINKSKILDSIIKFLNDQQVLEQLPLENCVLDFILLELEDGNYKVYICEINPLAEFAGTGLFSWLTDRSILLGKEPFEFRIRENADKDLWKKIDKKWLNMLNEFNKTCC